MKLRTVALSFLAFGALLAEVAPVVAHHSFSAEFDSAKPVTLRGYVTKIEWTNPHVWIYMDVKDDKGVKTNWGFEMGPPHLLQGSGWNREKLKIGDELIVDGSRAKNGTNKMNARAVKFAATGLSLQAGSSQGQPGQQ
ncbi:MAG TPA: DUF6152 family protein [Terriglobia bacterium]|nr:DUF6152 family protein [Terriglobia bacterium]